MEETGKLQQAEVEEKDKNLAKTKDEHAKEIELSKNLKKD